ncbi:MAG TPA: hypothetical protein VMY87_08950 [Armatimonadota bacterium]|nr:hypothetical protein [Armatimonadota bacterium]
MANPFQAAARGQAIRRLIATILSGKERDIAREDELGEIERRMQQERWQRGMAERGLDLEGRRVAEAERAGPAGEALTGMQQALMERIARLEETGRAERWTEPSGTALLPYTRGPTPEEEAGRASREFLGTLPYLSRTAESQYMFGGGEGELTPPAGVAPGTPPGLWGEYPKPPAPMEGGFGGLPAGPIDPRAAQLLVQMLLHREPSGGDLLRARTGGGGGGGGAYGMGTEEKNIRVEIRNLYADRDGGVKEVTDEMGTVRQVRVVGVPPGTARYNELTRQIQVLEARRPEGGVPAGPPTLRTEGRPSWMGGASRLGIGAPGVLGPGMSIDELAAQYGG